MEDNFSILSSQIRSFFHRLCLFVYLSIRGRSVSLVTFCESFALHGLGGPPRKDWKDEKIFSDESEDMKKLQEMDRQKSKRLEKEDSNLKEVIKKEKQSVEDYEKRKQELQDEVCVVFFFSLPLPTQDAIVVAFLTGLGWDRCVWQFLLVFFGNDSKLPNSFPLKMNECYLFKGTISKGKGKEQVFQSYALED